MVLHSTVNLMSIHRIHSFMYLFIDEIVYTDQILAIGSCAFVLNNVSKRIFTVVQLPVLLYMNMYMSAFLVCI